jgi:hypothetical protein
MGSPHMKRRLKRRSEARPISAAGLIATARNLPRLAQLRAFAPRFQFMGATAYSSLPGSGLQSVADAGKGAPPSAARGVACRSAMPPSAPTANT